METGISRHFVPSGGLEQLEHWSKPDAGNAKLHPVNG